MRHGLAAGTSLNPALNRRPARNLNAERQGITLNAKLAQWQPVLESGERLVLRQIAPLFHTSDTTYRSDSVLGAKMAPQAVLGTACLGGRLGIRQPLRRSSVSHGIAQARPLQSRSLRPSAFSVSSLGSRPEAQVSSHTIRLIVLHSADGKAHQLTLVLDIAEGEGRTTPASAVPSLDNSARCQGRIGCS